MVPRAWLTYVLLLCFGTFALDATPDVCNKQDADAASLLQDRVRVETKHFNRLDNVEATQDTIQAAVLNTASIGSVGVKKVLKGIEDDLMLPVPRTGRSNSFHVPYEIRESTIKGAGLGVFSTAGIPSGHMIWKNHPQDNLLVDPKEINDMRQSLLEASHKVRQELFAWTCGDDIDTDMFFELDDGRLFNDAHSSKTNVHPCGPYGANLCASRAISGGEEFLEDYTGEDVFQAEWLLKFEAEFKDREPWHYQSDVEAHITGLDSKAK